MFVLEGSTRQEVKGESHYQDSLSKICGGRTRDGHELDVIAELKPEPSNEFDANAVAVFVQGRQVGYLPKAQAAKLQLSIARLAKSERGGVGCRAQIVGGWDRGPSDQGHFGVRLFFDATKVG